MDSIKFWWSESWGHLRDRWTRHAGPSAVLFGVPFLLNTIGSFVMAVLFTVVVVGVLIAFDGEPPEVGWFALLFGGSFVFMFATMALYLLIAILIAPLFLGYMRGTLALMRGEPFGLRDLLVSPGDGIQAIVLLSLIWMAVLFGTQLFFVVGIVAAAACMCALPAMADEGIGPFAAIGRSCSLFKRRPWELCGWVMALMLIVMLVAYIPLIGIMLITPVWMVFTAVAYADLRRMEESERAEEPFPISAADLSRSPVPAAAVPPTS